MEFNEWAEAAIEESVPQKQIFRSSYRNCFIKIGVLTNLHCARVKLQTSAWNFVKKKGSDTGIFQWILWNFYKHLFYRTTLDDCF